ncbi:MAG: methionyl-tRNA formyltransferase, partial [Candidatus Pacebacteria bacterium]|nr:methionyl-tRNA formyltransferase [Candidatus Paceibacterota bacterium]
NMNKNISKLNIAFFGSPQFAVYALDELEQHNIVPSLVVTQPDRPAGRKMQLTSPEAKIWAEERNLATFQPEDLRDKETITALKDEGPWDIFIVASYGNIIPKEILDIPKHGTLNIHPSLLPKHRGATPLQAAILEDNETGVTIMLMDEKMDHGAIVTQEKTKTDTWPVRASKLEKITAEQGAKMIANVLDDLIQGKIEPKEQDHEQATFTKKLTKQDGLIDIENGDPKENYRKILAYDIFPRAYFFTEKNGKKIRVVITDADLIDGKLIITRVIPEGKKEMDYKVFLKE